MRIFSSLLAVICLGIMAVSVFFDMLLYCHYSPWTAAWIMLLLMLPLLWTISNYTVGCR